MATATTDTYSYAYELDPSTLKLKSSAVTEPYATGVKVKDPDGGAISSGDTVKVTKEIDGSGTLSTADKYIFVGSATVADHGTPLAGIIVEDKSTGSYFFLTDTKYTGDLTGNNGTASLSSLSSTSLPNAICFMAGTMVRTPDGEVAVETLKHGDRVLTHDGQIATVDWLGIQTVSLVFADKLRVLPIRIKVGALGDNVPSRDLLVSPDHAILVEGALVHAGALVNGTSIVRETNVPTTFTYYHVEVEDHSLILAENTPAETFVDNIDRLHFDNWAEHEALYPNGKSVTELPYPRAKSHRQVPVSTRVMLAARAQALFGSEEAAVA